MSHTAEYMAKLPTMLDKDIDLLKKEVATLQEQRRQEGLFLDVKNETAAIQKAKEEAKKILGAANTEAQQILESAAAEASKIKEDATAVANSTTSTADSLLTKAYIRAKELREESEELTKREEALAPAEADLKSRENKLMMAIKTFNYQIDTLIASASALKG